ncbi:MAG TPA: hypothetical protein VH677_03140 [Nitrososphaera sp.]|jgi:hypothetical protein
MPVAVAAVAGLLFALPLSASATWFGTEGCTPGYWKNHADTNPRVAELYGINLNAAILDITGLNLGAPAGLTIDQAVALKGGGANALYRALAAGVFNYYYGDPNVGANIVYIDPALFTSYVQKALDGDVTGAASAVDKANNLGCPIDSFGRRA